MSNLLLDNKQALEVCRNATISACEGKVDENFLNRLLSSMEGAVKKQRRSMQASANLVSAFVWSKVSCEPDDKPWIFKEDAWGPGIGGGSCSGIMYHAYTDDVFGWDNFFHEAVAYHAQGISSMGGIFQITWFRKDGAPIGQFNGAMAGAGVFEIGGNCKWKPKNK